MTTQITFARAAAMHQATIFTWLAEPHIQEFWDNTPEHKADIKNFLAGRRTPSKYADGKYTYWIASMGGTPYAMIMTIQETFDDNIGEFKRAYLSKTGNSYGLDYMIGNTDFLGKGYGAQTLELFINFFHNIIDTQADTFLIDPTSDNYRAQRVYIKAEFDYMGEFIMTGNYSGSGKKHCLFVKSI